MNRHRLRETDGQSVDSSPELREFLKQFGTPLEEAEPPRRNEGRDGPRIPPQTYHLEDREALRRHGRRAARLRGLRRFREALGEEAGTNLKRRVEVAAIREWVEASDVYSGPWVRSRMWDALQEAAGGTFSRVLPPERRRTVRRQVEPEDCRRLTSGVLWEKVSAFFDPESQGLEAFSTQVAKLTNRVGDGVYRAVFAENHKARGKRQERQEPIGDNATNGEPPTEGDGGLSMDRRLLQSLRPPANRSGLHQDLWILYGRLNEDARKLLAAMEAVTGMNVSGTAEFLGWKRYRARQAWAEVKQAASGL